MSCAAALRKPAPMPEHLSFLCKIQQGIDHRPCRSQECDCEACYLLPQGRQCECECHA